MPSAHVVRVEPQGVEPPKCTDGLLQCKSGVDLQPIHEYLAAETNHSPDDSSGAQVDDPPSYDTDTVGGMVPPRFIFQNRGPQQELVVDDDDSNLQGQMPPQQDTEVQEVDAQSSPEEPACEALSTEQLASLLDLLRTRGGDQPQQGACVVATLSALLPCLATASPIAVRSRRGWASY